MVGVFLGILATDPNFSELYTIKDYLMYFISNGFLAQMIIAPLIIAMLVSIAVYIFEEINQW